MAGVGYTSEGEVVEMLQRVIVIVSIIVASLLTPFAAFAKQPELIVEILPGDDIEEDMNGDFNVPYDKRLTWAVTVIIKNPTDVSFKDVHWKNNYDAAMEFASVDATGGHVDYTKKSPPAQMSWTINTLGPYEEYRLDFVLATRVNNGGHQLYTKNDVGCKAWESGAVFKYKTPGVPGQTSQEFPARLRCVGEKPPWISIDMTTRKDWRIRRAGIYASPAAEINVASNRHVTVQFSDFLNLESLDHLDAAPIESFYSWGDTLSEADGNGWVPGDRLEPWVFYASPELEAGMTRTLWQRLDVFEHHRSSDYEEQGMITFILQNTAPYVSPIF